MPLEKADPLPYLASYICALASRLRSKEEAKEERALVGAETEVSL